jgi:1,4-alpha-glucan branching enzyme
LWWWPTSPPRAIPFNTDAERYGGSNLGNLGGKFTDQWGIHGYDQSLDLCLPPLSVLVFRRDEIRSQQMDEDTCDEAADSGALLG